MASLMVGNGSIVAFERSPARLATLERRIVQQGAEKIVVAREGDFMEVDVESEFSEVSHVLIDPSCSGSGLIAGKLAAIEK
jgi:putative methyltransferase